VAQSSAGQARYRQAWERRWAVLRQEERARAERARRVLPDVVEDLARRGAKRVILFGSLATGRFGLDSDIDLAVSGVEDLFAAGAEAERLAGMRVDLVPLEDAHAHVAKRVASEGTILYERPR
jgi:predicted nucleotidyltransferase